VRLAHRSQHSSPFGAPQPVQCMVPWWGAYGPPQLGARVAVPETACGQGSVWETKFALFRWKVLRSTKNGLTCAPEQAKTVFVCSAAAHVPKYAPEQQTLELHVADMWRPYWRHNLEGVHRGSTPAAVGWLPSARVPPSEAHLRHGVPFSFPTLPGLVHGEGSGPWGHRARAPTKTPKGQYGSVLVR
jgi:hypothetical protein